MKILLIRNDLLSECQKEVLEKKGANFITIQPDDFQLFQESMDNFDYEVIVGATELSKLNYEKCYKLRFIQAISAGYDYLKVSDLFERDIKLSNASGVYSIPIAEWVIGLILSDYKQFEYFYEKYKKKEWNSKYNLKELTNKKVLIFGTGSIGEEITKRLRNFNCVIDGVNRNGREIHYFNKCFTLKNARVIVNEYDILIFALPSNENTNKYIDMDLLSKLREETIVINIGRGDLINETDLIKYVTSNKKNVRFYLDVVNEEPLDKKSELWQSKEIFITPHNSFSSDKHKDRLQSLIYTNINSAMDELNLINEVKGE